MDRNSPSRHLPIADKESLAGPPPAGSDPGADGGRAGAGEERLLQVGDIAKACGKTVRAIHHYEEVGLLRPSARSKGRYRLYDQGAVARIRWIGKLHDLGLSLSQIQAIVRNWEASPSAPEAMAKMRAVYEAQLEQTRIQIEHLRMLERELAASLEYLDTCGACDPAELVAACSDCNVHDPAELQPELVAGIHGKPVCRDARPSGETYGNGDGAQRTRR